MSKEFEPQITAFYCINSYADPIGPDDGQRENYFLKTVKMPCSSSVRRVFLLRAFEAGADGVVVLVCPHEACRYVKGSYRAGKRIAWVKKLLDEIGIGGDRLFLHTIKQTDADGFDRILAETAKKVAALGPNPANG
jgi:F420-non-reducing hydrogenase iron-sulfur subunit